MNIAKFFLFLIIGAIELTLLFFFWPFFLAGLVVIVLIMWAAGRASE